MFCLTLAYSFRVYMKKLFSIIAILSVLVSSAAYADNITAKVQGMVCAFCASGIEKVFKKREEVESVKVDLDKMLVTITTKKGKKLDKATVEKLITDGGYTVSDIKIE